MFKFNNPFENKPDEQTGEEGEKVEQQENIIENTAGFKKAVSEGRLQEAEDWLLSAYKNDERYKDKVDWLDHSSRKLFQAYYTNKDWANAKRMVDLGKDEDSKQGRRDKLAEEAGILFDEI